MGAALCMLSSKSAPSGAHPRPKYLCAGTAPLNHAKGQLLDICPELMLAVLTYLPPAEAHALIAIAEKHSFSEEPDSTDLLPSHELYLLQRGRPAVEPVWAAIGERVERCVLPFVRTKFGCPNCVPCVSMVRRYKASERLRVTTHRDIESSVTMVVELRPAGATPEAAVRASLLASAAKLSPTTTTKLSPTTYACASRSSKPWSTASSTGTRSRQR